jgi:hypothetical protein
MSASAMRSSWPPFAHEERVAEIEHLVDQIERHFFHDLVAEDRHHDRDDQRRQIRNRVSGMRAAVASMIAERV